jgi:phosphoglycolate phosphatase
MTYKAVLFDMDGTLLNTLTDIGESANRVMTAKGFPPHPIDDYRYFVGEGARKLMTDVLPDGEKSMENINECLKAFETDYAIHWKTNTQPYEGIERLLDDLTEKQIIINILSNKPHHITLDCVADMLGKWKFEVVFGQRDHIPKKPDATAALEVAEILGISVNEFLYVGDTKIDMMTANSAGMHAVGVTWGFRPREELTASGAKAIIDQPSQLLDLL